MLTEHALGNIPQTIAELKGSYTSFGVDGGLDKLVDEPEETEVLRQWLPMGRYQGDIGACNLFTTGKIFEACHDMQGLGKVELSYNSGYWALNGGQSYGAGTLPEESLQYMLKTGLPLRSARLPVISHKPIPLTAEEKDQALNARFDEAHLCKTWTQLFNAIMAGFYCDGGIVWWDTDGKTAPDGRLPVRGGGRSGGHSVVFMGLKHFDAASRHNGLQLESGWHVLINNHHGDSKCEPFTFADGTRVKPQPWGLDGYGYVPLGRIADGMKKFVFWSLRTVRIDVAPVPMPIFEDAPKELPVRETLEDMAT